MLLCHKKYGGVEVDEYLFSGFLSAINTMVESEFDQRGVESIKMYDYNLIYEQYCGIVFTIAADPKESEKELKQLLVEIREEFFTQFEDVPWLEFIKILAKGGEFDQFETFEPTLDKIITKFKTQKEEIVKNKKKLLEFYSSAIITLIEKVIFQPNNSFFPSKFL